MGTPPTFVTDVEGAAGWGSSATPKTTATFNGSTNDVLVTLLTDSNDNGGEAYTFTSTPAETWTELAETTGTTNADVWMQPAWTVLTADRTGMAAIATRTGGDAVPFNILTAIFTGSDGVGAYAKSPGNGGAAPALGITTLFDNSAIIYMVGDWAATDGATRTHRSVNGFTPTAGNGQELLYFTDGSNYTVYCAYIPDAGNAGAQTVGISAPGTGDCLVIAVEIQGTPGAPPSGPFPMLRPAVVAP